MPRKSKRGGIDASAEPPANTGAVLDSSGSGSPVFAVASGASTLGVGVAQGATVRLVGFANAEDASPVASDRGVIS